MRFRYAPVHPGDRLALVFARHPLVKRFVLLSFPFCLSYQRYLEIGWNGNGEISDLLRSQDIWIVLQQCNKNDLRLIALYINFLLSHRHHSMFYHSMFYHSTFYHSTFYRSTFYHSTFYHSMFYHSSLCFTTPLHSMFYHMPGKRSKIKKCPWFREQNVNSEISQQKSTLWWDDNWASPATWRSVH